MKKATVQSKGEFFSLILSNWLRHGATREATIMYEETSLSYINRAIDALKIAKEELSRQSLDENNRKFCNNLAQKYINEAQDHLVQADLLMEGFLKS